MVLPGICWITLEVLTGAEGHAIPDDLVVVCVSKHCSCKFFSPFPINLYHNYSLTQSSMQSVKVTATEIMGDIFENRGLQLFGCAMTIALIIVWIIVFLAMVTCLKQKKLLWPKSSS